MKLKCERCSQKFDCGAQNVEPCWCMSLPPVKQVADTYRDCLCPHCLKELEELAEKNSGNVTRPSEKQGQKAKSTSQVSI